MNDAPQHMTIGEILKEEFLEPLQLSQYRVAKDTGIPESTLSKIINGRARITTEISIRLGRYFSCAPDYFGRLQLGCEIYNNRTSIEAAAKEIEPMVAAEEQARYNS